MFSTIAGGSDSGWRAPAPQSGQLPGNHGALSLKSAATRRFVSRESQLCEQGVAAKVTKM